MAGISNGESIPKARQRPRRHVQGLWLDHRDILVSSPAQAEIDRMSAKGAMLVSQVTVVVGVCHSSLLPVIMNGIMGNTW